MAEDNGTARVSTNESIVSSESSEKRKRRKRKWDQPAEFLVSVGAVLPGIFPMANVGSLVGASYPMVAPVSVQTTTSPQLLQASPLQQNVAQIQDELIAREMVINDAESSVRYKLTKRQTQEEIQKCTGAVVITRGKYHPPNAPPDGEKPLYLHISAGAHLKEMSERIIAIDRAASMVEEILQQSTSLEQLSSTFHVVDGAKLPQVSQSLSTCVYLGFEADLAMNVVARIRGPNDQYINHIINETGVNVLLRGRGSGDLESTQSQEQEPLHLFLCGSNSKNLEEARCLAENLLDTISTEFGASRAPSRKVYNAVPPPSQLASEVLLSQIYGKVNEYSNGALSLSNMGSLPIPPMPSVSGPGGVTVFSQGTAIQTNLVQKPHHSVGGATCYNGYGGIYPQATPLQQVALALRQPPSCLTSAITPTTSQATTEVSASVNAVAEKKPPQRRKFQELPVTSKGSTSTPAYQGSSMQKKTEPIGARHISMMPPPLKLLHQSNGMPQSHPRSMPPAPSPLSGMMPPPPPPKFTESAPKAEVPDKKSLISLKTEAVPDTLIKLMEYGEEDDDDDDVPEERNDESLRSCINAVPTQKPFWAL